ncbi:MAG TPA: GNAT family N-acetyltransferase [Candidatus Binatia bacterium]
MEGSRVVVVDPEQLEPYLLAWEELAADAVETNVFYEPWMLMPALRLWGGSDEIVLVLVFAIERLNGASRERLAGIFPLQYQTYYREVPIRTLKLWQYDYCFLSTPLVGNHGAARTVRAFLEWLAVNPLNAALMEFRDIDGDGAFHNLLIEELRRSGQLACVMDSYTRPVLTRRCDGETYLHESLAKKRRKELNRLRRRLADCGRVECFELEPSHDVTAWTDDFLALEAASWKGRAGSAMKLDAASREFFTTIACESFRRGRLMMLGLYLDGRAVAMKCNFLAAPGSFSFKIAYDESLSRFSPGMQLEIENIRHFHGKPCIQWMDSCTAVEDHFMMNHLWRDRRSIETLTVATGHWSGHLVVSVLPIRQWIRRKVKGGFLGRRS